MSKKLVATTSVLLVVGFWKDFDLEGHSTSTNPRQIAKRICRGYHVPRGKRVATVSSLVTVGCSFDDETTVNSKDGLRGYLRVTEPQAPFELQSLRL
jgi:hypothetical protein